MNVRHTDINDQNVTLEILSVSVFYVPEAWTLQSSAKKTDLTPCG